MPVFFFFGWRDPTNRSHSPGSPGQPTADPSRLPLFPISPPRPLRSRDVCPSRKAVGLMVAIRRATKHAAIRIWTRRELEETAPRYGLQPSSHQLCLRRISSLTPGPSTAATFGDPQLLSRTQALPPVCRRSNRRPRSAWVLAGHTTLRRSSPSRRRRQNRTPIREITKPSLPIPPRPRPRYGTSWTSSSPASTASN